ncbi:MAG: hypothetical protein IPJ75_13760 [Ignavibacteriales bacterium]|nr:hypothetical protein [Ignavibacteriales bacterium]
MSDNSLKSTNKTDKKIIIYSAKYTFKMKKKKPLTELLLFTISIKLFCIKSITSAE